MVELVIIDDDVRRCSLAEILGVQCCDPVQSLTKACRWREVVDIRADHEENDDGAHDRFQG